MRLPVHCSPASRPRQAAPAVGSSGFHPRALRLGFVPLTDCAPIVMAYELGLFSQYGLRVTLSRELGWATIRDKIIHLELDAAHALAPMPIAATLGLGSVRCPCVTGLVLNLHGNAITLSRGLWSSGVRDAATLREEILRRRRDKMFTFGAVAPLSSHYYLLRQWLATAGIQPDRDVRIVTVPPPQMVSNLKAGHLDGFCVGEPWNSVAVRDGVGWCAAVSAELSPGHPEKVIMVRREFAEKRSREHLALLAAILQACQFCDTPANQQQVLATLARPEYVGVPAADLERGASGMFDFGYGRVRTVPDFNVFHRLEANEPSADKVAWIVKQLREHNGVDPAACSIPLGRRIFSSQIYESAVRLLESRADESNESNLALSV